LSALADSEMRRDSYFRFCTLEYRPRKWGADPSGIAPVVVLVLMGREDDLLFLIHPELRTIVRKEDSVFVESLLRDFIKRAKVHPDALFKHLCSLGAGPLLTQTVGSSLSDHPSILELSSRFVELR